MQETRFSLPPASAMACRMTLTVSRMQRRAVGWGENTMALPALMAISALYRVVDVGLVEGIRPAMTPMGTAMVRTFFTSSRSSSPTVFMSLMYS